MTPFMPASYKTVYTSGPWVMCQGACWRRKLKSQLDSVIPLRRLSLAQALHGMPHIYTSKVIAFTTKGPWSSERRRIHSSLRNKKGKQRNATACPVLAMMTGRGQHPTQGYNPREKGSPRSEPHVTPALQWWGRVAEKEAGIFLGRGHVSV